jgi:hypothetical protein
VSGKNIWVLTKTPQSQALYRGILGPKYGLNFIETIEKFETDLKQSSSSSHVLIVSAEDISSTRDTLSSLSHRTPILLVFPPTETPGLESARPLLLNQNFDFIQSPLREGELLTRLEILLGRSQSSDIELTNREAQIFSVFKRSDGKPIQRKALIREVWGNVTVCTKTLDVHLFHLRKKIFKTGLKIHFSPPDTFTLINDSTPDS